MNGIVEKARALAAELAALPELERIDALNAVRSVLHEVSPLKHHPIDLVLWVPAASVEANDYNPNRTAPTEMRLLELSIESDGYTQPVVTWTEEERRETVDGFHRGEIGRTSQAVRATTLDCCPSPRSTSPAPTVVIESPPQSGITGRAANMWWTA